MEWQTNVMSDLPHEFQGILQQIWEADAQSEFHVFREGSSHRDEERFRRLIEGLHFSKKLILSYQLVLLGLLLCFTAAHWGWRLGAWRRRRRRVAAARQHIAHDGYIADNAKVTGRAIVKSRSSGISSPSSTLEPDSKGIICDTKGADERSLLLPRPNNFSKDTQIRYVSRKLQAWLVYQPEPLHVINKTLPSNGASVAILLFLVLQIFYTLYKISFSLSMLFVFADRTSLLFVANLPLLYLFAAKNQPIKFLTGNSYEALNIIHRRLGEYMCLLAFLHSAGMIGVWYTILRPTGIDLLHFLLSKMILLGSGAFIAYELIYFTSLGSFRQRWYELFLVCHVVLQAAALVLVWFHHHSSRPYVGIALGIFLIDRIVYRMLMRRTRLHASLKLQEDKHTAILHASVPLVGQSGTLKGFLGAGGITGGWKATEHVFLTVPSLAPKHLVQAHPFTIASQAPLSDTDNANLDLLIRAQRGFSADLVRYAQCRDSAAIILDGPYGSLTSLNLLQTSDHAIIIAGGSGIAVTWPLVKSLLEAPVSDLECLTRPRDKRQILFVWIIREQAHVSWLGHERLKSLEAEGVTVVIPPPTMEQGHPNVQLLVEKWMNDLPDHESNAEIGVVASGPDGLNRTVRNSCASMIGEGHIVTIEIEKFGW